MNKEKRQKRFQQKNRHIERQKDIARVCNHSFYMNDNNRHRLHKMKAIDCGIPGCYMCANPRRTRGEKTLQETKFECVSVDD
jgi:hypothetical protein